MRSAHRIGFMAMLVGLAAARLAIGQEQATKENVLRDPVAALESVSREGQPLTFTLGEEFKLPPGGHLQGIQMRYDAAGKRHLLFLSHDSVMFGYLLVVEFPAASAADFSEPGRAIHLQRFPSDGQSPPLRHAGGFQLLGSTLAVGVEDNQDKRRSQVQFWDVASPTSPRQLAHLTIERASSEPMDVTAGGVALIEHGQRHVVAVANWDSRAIDFYPSNERPLADQECHFELGSRWTVAGADKSDWQPDQEFSTYQAINFVTDEGGALYLLGFNTEGLGQNLVELFAVDLNAPAPKQLRKLTRKIVRLTGGTNFRAGGGAWVHDGKLSVLATERNIGRETTLNVAR